ncbi:MAG: hypothetical protein IPN26_12760 [Bacteroidetes bacterium]|nr:hypothetical protein [Bacteroidota bacterium]
MFRFDGMNDMQSQLETKLKQALENENRGNQFLPKKIPIFDRINFYYENLYFPIAVLGLFFFLTGSSSELSSKY